MEKEFKQRGVAEYKGLNVSASKIVTISFKFRYDEMITSINLLQGLNTDITVHARISGSKAKNLGIFTISGVSFDKDGNASVQFKSMVENVNLDNITDVISADDDDILQLQFLAVLELPDKEENKEE